jgi:alpha-glucosidase (family GH31 glycosyl hydrolase)
VRPLVFDFPELTTENRDQNNYLIGKFLLVTPLTVSKSGQKNRLYLPAGRKWANPFTNMVVKDDMYEQELTTQTVHLRDGIIIPFQLQEDVMTTDELTKSDISLKIFPDKNGFAEGKYYLDDGNSNFSE